ncbi:hypothetical protein ADUPG1_001186, partial [Aduncisulcus paluster]
MSRLSEYLVNMKCWPIIPSIRHDPSPSLILSVMSTLSFCISGTSLCRLPTRALALSSREVKRRVCMELVAGVERWRERERRDLELRKGEKKRRDEWKKEEKRKRKKEEEKRKREKRNDSIINIVNVEERIERILCMTEYEEGKRLTLIPTNSAQSESALLDSSSSPSLFSLDALLAS